eukprot:276284_1
MLTLLFTILLTLTQSGKNGGCCKDCPCGRRLLQNAAVPLPTATESTGNSAGNGAGNCAGNGAGNAAGSGATEMECILSKKDPAGCAGRTTKMVNPQHRN